MPAGEASLSGGRIPTAIGADKARKHPVLPQFEIRCL
jgi:hypothetical protein